MSKLFKSVISIFTAAVMCFGVCVTAFAAPDATTAKAMRFNEDGSFRIMHVTDTHLSAENVDASAWLIANACDREQPDLIALTGDIAVSGDREEILTCIDKLMSVFNSRNIPVAIAFGNHDSESGEFAREELMGIYNSYPCSISVDDGDLLPGCGTYNIPVLASDSDKVKFNVWMFDSCDYDEEHRYSNVLAEQVEWYKQKSEALERANGGEKVYSLAFQHIIVPEIYDALQKHDNWIGYSYEHLYRPGEYYTFNPEVENHGLLHETPCPGYYNNGQFDAMVERGDVLGMFFGHDHTNGFSVKYKGIHITNTQSTRYNGDAFSTQYGYRVIDVDENDTSTYKTYVQQWFDCFNGSDVKELKASGDIYGAKLARKVMVNGFFQRTAQRFAFWFVHLVTGRTVCYK